MQGDMSTGKRRPGRPRKNPPAQSRAPLTNEERSELARAAWASRKPSYRPQKSITLRADVFDVLDAKRPDGSSWASFLCAAVGVPEPPDRRLRRED